MNINRYFVWRDGITHAVPASEFRMTDFVLTTTGQYVAAPELWRLSKPASNLESESNWPTNVVIAGVALGALWLLVECLSPKPQPRLVWRRNLERIESWKKEYVTERDRWRCTCCQRRVTRRNRHIDHSVSRRNGGSNHLNNVRTACRNCNLEKGALNARQFLAA